MASTWSTACTFETWRDDAVIGNGKRLDNDDAIITTGSSTLSLSLSTSKGDNTVTNNNI